MSRPCPRFARRRPSRSWLKQPPRQPSHGYAGCGSLSTRCRVAKFLEGRGEVAKALEVAKDPEYRFELAVQLSDFDVAVAIAETLASPARWKQLGELALSDGRLPLAQRCLTQSDDLSGMMLMFTATGNRAGMRVRPSALLRAVLSCVLTLCCAADTSDLVHSTCDLFSVRPMCVPPMCTKRGTNRCWARKRCSPLYTARVGGRNVCP